MSARTAAAPKDRFEDRLCRAPADRTKDTVLVATGDSITAAHHQEKSGKDLDCTTNGMTKDHRGLWGNDMKFSYAGRYYENLNKNISEYYNFARTGFSTDDIINAKADTKDACKNDWNRVKPPLGLAKEAIEDAKTKNKQAYFVTTGGINNTNWTEILSQFAQCRVLEVLTEAFKATVASTKDTKFRWLTRTEPFPGTGKPDNILEKGGSCTGQWWVTTGPFTDPYLITPMVIRIPAYDGPGAPAANQTQLAKDIADHAKTIVDTMLGAGADKIVWMLYYDINRATIDLKAMVSDIMGAIKPIKLLKDLVPQIFNLDVASLIPDGLVGKVGGYEKDMNDAIKSKIAANAKVVLQPAPLIAESEIQKTVPLGCPHPNGKGHDKLANALKAALGA